MEKILNGPEPDVTIEPDGTVTQGFTANPEGQSRRTVMKHSWLRAPSGFLYCRNCLLVCQWPLVRSDDDCGYEAPVRRDPAESVADARELYRDSTNSGGEKL